jgi:hypothetical protein
MISVDHVDQQEELVNKNMVVLQGTVYDAETEDELKGVTVEVTELEAEAETNKEGEFYLENLKKDKAYTLTASKEGYKDFEKTIISKEKPMTEEGNSTWTVDIALEPKAEDDTQ